MRVVTSGGEVRGIALGGFMGVGKSTVGAALSSRTGLVLLDTDALLVARHGPVDRQFAERGEAAFRAREAALIAELTAGPPAVVATGGGAWVDPANRAALRRWGLTVVLTAPWPVIVGRVAGGAGRPLWPDAEALFVSRSAAYDDAERVIDTASRSVDAVVAEIVAAWEGT